MSNQPVYGGFLLGGIYVPRTTKKPEPIDPPADAFEPVSLVTLAAKVQVSRKSPSYMMMAESGRTPTIRKPRY